MINRKLFSGLTVLVITLFIMSCKKDNGDPTIIFVTGSDFGGKDTVMMVGDTLPVTIEVSWNGTDVLDNLDIRLDDVSVGNATVDETTALYTINLIKGVNETERWSFIIIDKSDNQAQLNLTLTKDPNSVYGAVSVVNVTLGAQKNTTLPGFLSLQKNQYYLLDNAFTNQELVDLFFYFDPSTQSTLASPGSDIPDSIFSGYKDVILWSVRNVSTFIKSDMSLQVFNTMTSDAPIIKNWNNNQTVSRADNLAVDDIWLVKLKSGKMGAILVKSVTTGEEGQVEFDLKIQK